MNLEEIILKLFAGLFVQFWSWGAWAAAMIACCENRAYTDLRCSTLPRWLYVPRGVLLSRLEGILSGVMFGVAGIHLNLLVTNPANLFRDVHIPYLGVFGNLVVFGLVAREIIWLQPLPLPEKYGLLSFIQYTIRRNIRSRVLAGLSAVLMSLGTWLFPWCCVR